MKYIKTIIFLHFFIFLTTISYSQDELKYENYIYDENIHTVLLRPETKDFGMPIIELNTEQKLVLEFDNLQNNTEDYSYTFIYCNSDWTPANLNVMEYIDGYSEGEISEYSPSFNTLVHYNHYSLVFPEENMNLIISGNYLLVVYKDYDIENVVLTRRFYVIENKVELLAKVKRSSLVSDMYKKQEISFNIIDNSYYASSDPDAITVKIIQNNRFDNILTVEHADFIKGNVYEYNNPRKINFKAGNEFRYFNCKNYKFLNDKVVRISYQKPYYIFSLINEIAVSTKPYSYQQDINGNMVITADDVENDEVEADYVLVDFNLKQEFKLPTGDFYVFGEISDFRLSANHKMTYNETTEAYELRLKLKQGFYNYLYVFAENLDSEIITETIEGNYYETENSYQIFVYYREQGSEFDKIIGYEVFNSLRKL